MPEVAGSWPEEGTPYPPGAPMEPVQQPYQQHAQYQQSYPQQPYAEAPQYQQGQQQYAPGPQAGSYQEQTVPQQPVFFEEEHTSVPSEFDHLFRDSVPTDRRSISRQAVIGGAPPAPAFGQAPAAQPAPAQPAATAMFPQQDQAEQTRTSAGYPQPGYGGPGVPGGPGEEPGGGSGRNRTPLVIGGVVVVIAAVGLYLGLSGGSGSSGGQPNAGSTHTSAPPAQTEQQQADALYNLVKQAKDLRSEINGGYDDLVACNIPGAQSEIGTAVAGRQAALTQLGQLDVSKISQGTELVADLKNAWTYSYNTDQDYAKAAADFGGGATCTKKAVQDDANFEAADSGSGDSSRAKSTAADLWNQVMPTYNEPKITSGEI